LSRGIEVSSILFVGINTKFEIFRVILIKYSLSLGTRGERKASDRKRKRHNKMLGNARHKGNGFSCIECSVLFTTPCEKAISIIPRNFIVDGVALCEMCTSSGPSQKVTDRRDWSHVDVGEELEYGENAPEIASERMAIHIGGHEKQSRLHPTLRGPKGGGRSQMIALGKAMVLGLGTRRILQCTSLSGGGKIL
jgi:hypothetical protein